MKLIKAQIERVWGALDFTYRHLSSEKAKFLLGATGIFVAAVFSVLKWFLPLWWERQPNFDVSFTGNEGVFIQSVLLENNPDQCVVSGTINIKNEGSSPIPIQNTHLIVIPYDVEKCNVESDRCVSTQNIPPEFLKSDKKLVETDIEELLAEYHSITLYPVTNEHDLFSGSNATRVFSLAIPTVQIQRERMLVLAHQEIGEIGCTPFHSESGFFKPICDSSRATISVPYPCKALIKKSEIEAEIVDLIALRNKYKKNGVSTDSLDKRINSLVLEQIDAKE
jgi:hypothetical protein